MLVPWRVVSYFNCDGTGKSCLITKKGAFQKNWNPKVMIEISRLILE